MSSRERIETIHALIQEELAGLPLEKHDPAQGLPLLVPGLGPQEVKAAVDVLLSTWVTMGKEVASFEQEWAHFCGVDHGVMVNSGSSANLIALACLLHCGRLKPGDEVLVPAVSWSTSLFPVHQLGLTPVLVDVDEDSLCISPALAREAMSERTRAVMAVHLLGQPVDVPGLEELGLLVVEDACGAHGARWGDSRVGSLGTLGTFSFFFSHHITTVEGGMVVSRDPELMDAARSLRAHGWTREMEQRSRWERAHPEIDPRFLFVSAGWNLRPTEMAGAIGRAQLMRLESWLLQRRRNHHRWCELLREVPWLRCFPELDGEHAGFAFPMLIQEGAPFQRRDLQHYLEEARIMTRPISGSNLARQPVASRLPGMRLAGPFTQADAVHERGFFVGNSHAFDDRHGELLASRLMEFMDGF